MEDTCVCCGEYIPEGRMVCYSCEEMDEDILVVRVNMFLKNKEQEAVRQYILEQRKTGVIVLPLYCEAIMVPKDVEIKFEGVETDGESNL
ncbi:MAG: hypothetical protein WDA37_00165 [Dysgonamonadaceae bacterium]